MLSTDLVEPVVYNARLVATCCQQKHAIDYQETYTPVARLATVRTDLSFGIHKGCMQEAGNQRSYN